MATGHYCRTRQHEGEFQLLKGADPNKDQSYFLYTVKSAILEHVLFPLGEMLKPEIREIAKKYRLPVYAKKDSTGICFIGKRDFKDFLGQYIKSTPGEFQTIDGKVVGQHDGFPFYTIGQRRGLGIGGAGEAWFVVGKDVERNIVFVEQGAEHPLLFSSHLQADEATWISNRTIPKFPVECTSKIRYRQKDDPCCIEKIDQDMVFVTFSEKQRAVTPRQSIVFYHDEVCLGGGLIVPR